MSAFTAPDGERVAIFGEGGGQLLADELDVPLLAKVPLSGELREHADAGTPLVIDDTNAPASQMIREAARGIVAATPVELPVMQAAATSSHSAGTNTAAGSDGGRVSGTELPMVQ
jgi:ATP-binding protein involved in chromosome partitioning